MRYKKSLFVILMIMAMLLNQPEFARANQTDMVTWSSQSACFFDSYSDFDSACDEEGKYHLMYFLNGGVVDGELQETFVEAELPISLPIPTREGYNFAGWYRDNNYRHRINSITWDNCGSYALFAKWTREIDSNASVQMYSYTTDSTVSGNDKKLAECCYGFVDSIDIPGMPSTREADYQDNLITTEAQCPQGICMTEDYCFITAYCSDDRENLGSLYVFDRHTGEYLVTLGMKKNSHLGGLTFDGRNLWICHSDTRTLECISYSYIRQVASEKPQIFVDCTGMFQEYRVANMPSCITYHDGLLWVATHNSYFKSVMVSYRYLDGKLVEQKRYEIPEKVQGIAFDEEDHVYLSTSYGRTKSSYLKVYNSVDSLNTDPGNCLIKVEMPPCSEEINYTDGTLYILFESASEKYFEGTDGNGTSVCPIDKILSVNVDSILSGE